MENSTLTHLAFSVTQRSDLVFNNGSKEYNKEDTLSLVNKLSVLIYSVAFLLGTAGNGLVIFFTAFRMKRTVNVVWFLNLAIADFIFTVSLPFSIVYTALNFHWPFGNFMCKMISAIMSINLYTSIFLLTVISIDRCSSVMFPVWCQNHRTPKRASLVALVVWIIAFFLSVPSFIFRDTSIKDDVVFCYHNFEVAKSIQTGIVIVRTILTFIIPFSIIVSCYCIIVLRIQKHRMNTTGKPFKITLAVIIVFFICWFPYHLFALLGLSAMHYNNDQLYSVVDDARPFISSLVFLNSCVNPFLYVFMGRDFKTKFYKSFHLVFENAFMEETGHTSFRSKSNTSKASTSECHHL